MRKGLPSDLRFRHSGCSPGAFREALDCNCSAYRLKPPPVTGSAYGITIFGGSGALAPGGKLGPGTVECSTRPVIGTGAGELGLGGTAIVGGEPPDVPEEVTGVVCTSGEGPGLLDEAGGHPEEPDRASDQQASAGDSDSPATMLPRIAATRACMDRFARLICRQLQGALILPSVDANDASGNVQIC
jgi:hypothetical protein